MKTAPIWLRIAMIAGAIIIVILVAVLICVPAP
jgi:hypothetical protein